MRSKELEICNALCRYTVTNMYTYKTGKYIIKSKILLRITNLHIRYIWYKLFMILLGCLYILYPIIDTVW